MNTANLDLTFQSNSCLDKQAKTKGIIAAIIGGFKDWREQVKEQSTFARLNDHLLRDIGREMPANKGIEVDRRWMG